MWEWASSRPQRCLKFGADSIAWAETERNWRGQRQHTCVMSPLSEGMIKPSPTDENVLDPSALANRIRALTNPDSVHQAVGGAMLSDLPHRIAVLLPDTAVRTTVLHLEQLPIRYEEREALIRWRLGQEQLFPLSGAKVLSQVFHDRSRGKGPAHTVLAVAVQESVLKQYEALCESVGLIPQEVGVTSLRIFDLWRRVSSGSHWRSRNCLWVNVSDRALTTMIFQQGRLLSYRCKRLGAEATEELRKTDMLNKTLEECCVSLEICQQQHPSVVVKEAVICVDGDIAAFQKLIEAELHMSVEQLGWESIEALGRVATGSDRGMTSLAAMAGVL
jgi:Tfp pilus assembly PilM family ATPase